MHHPKSEIARLYEAQFKVYWRFSIWFSIGINLGNIPASCGSEFVSQPHPWQCRYFPEFLICATLTGVRYLIDVLIWMFLIRSDEHFFKFPNGYPLFFREVFVSSSLFSRGVYILFGQSLWMSYVYWNKHFIKCVQCKCCLLFNCLLILAPVYFVIQNLLVWYSPIILNLIL